MGEPRKGGFRGENKAGAKRRPRTRACDRRITRAAEAARVLARAIGESEQAARWRAWSAVEPPKAAEGRDSAPTAAEGDENVRACSSPHKFFDIFLSAEKEISAACRTI